METALRRWLGISRRVLGLIRVYTLTQQTSRSASKYSYTTINRVGRVGSAVHTIILLLL